MRLLVTLLAVTVLTGCSHDFWYRPPRVAGQVQTPCPPPCPEVAPAPPTACEPSCPPACPEPYAAPCPPAAAAPCPPPGPAGLPRSTPPRVDRPLPIQAQAGGRPTCDEQAVFDEVNRIRCSMGLRPFRFSPSLHGIAEAHSREQSTYGYMGHSSPDPRRQTLLQRMQLGGYDGMVFGEVVAWGYRTPQSVVEGWMNSRDHRAILVDRDMQEAAYSRIGDYWTGNFGTPSARAAPAPRTGFVPAQAPPRTTYRPSVVPPPPSQELERAPTYSARPVPRTAPAPSTQTPLYGAPPAPRFQPRVWRPPLRGG